MFLNEDCTHIEHLKIEKASLGIYLVVDEDTFRINVKPSLKISFSPFYINHCHYICPRG
jgi:hypothetical protein